MISQTSTTKQNPRHISEWTQGSAVSEAIARLNIESLTAAEMNQRVYGQANPKTPIKHDGWWCRGVNWRNGQPLGESAGQGKPDQKHVTTKGEAKYLTGQGTVDAMFLAMPEVDYWSNLYQQAESYYRLTGEKTVLLWTEGAKKAACGLTADIATVCLTGVWNWGKASEGKLGFEVKNWMQPWFEHYLAFDSDYQFKDNCRLAIVRFAEYFKKEGCSLKILQWDTEHKGMDDYIKANGQRQFYNEISKAKTVAAWERQFKKPEERKRDRLPPANKIAREIAEDNRDLLAYREESQHWYRYSADHEGMWSEEPETYIESIIYSMVKGKGVEEIGSFSYITNVMKFLRCELNVRRWEEVNPKDFLPFRNGVLEVATGQLLPHSPGYRFTWQLPRQHNPLANNWETIDSWLEEATKGDESLRKFLLCFANAVLKGRSDLQIFCHLTGPGGTGKGTYIRLLTTLIGEVNSHTSTLADWNNNRFEPANAYLKRLLTFPDEDKYGGGLGTFKKATGGDWLRREIKSKQATQFRFDGMAIVASNFPIFSGDNSSGLSRRLRQIPLNNSVPKLLRRDLEREFESELDAFTNYVLSIPDRVVTATLLQTDIESTSMLKAAWEYRMESDVITDWLNSNVIHDPNATTQVGKDLSDEDTLFGNCYQFAQRNGRKPISSTAFSRRLLDLCRNQLGWTDVECDRRRLGTANPVSCFTGLRLRQNSDSNLPNPIEALYCAECAELTPHSAGLCADSYPLPDKGCAECAELTEPVIPVDISEIEDSGSSRVDQSSESSAIADNPPSPDQNKREFEQYDRVVIEDGKFFAVGYPNAIVVRDLVVTFISYLSQGFCVIEIEGQKFDIPVSKLSHWQLPQPEYNQNELLDDGYPGSDRS
ncbi:MAG: DUF3854 domain-containing protein [Desertifilum sp. SIO1I2]|nr:DUF3854 domain-containing protein [Desertifilum sp. SIO1I2]